MGLSSEALSASSILAHAERASGGYGLASSDLSDRLAKLVGMIAERGPYSVDQTLNMRQQIFRALVSRLRLALDRKRYPGIAEVQIERPIFVVGFPRSGTTFLHSLLAEDPDALSPRSWHQAQPSPPPGAGPVCSGRMALAQRRADEWMDHCQDMLPLHPFSDKGAQQLAEDEEIFGLDFRNAHPVHLYKVPTLDVAMILLDEDADGAYRFHREFLQHFQWNGTKTRWICKGPGHQHHLDSLFKTYPDALCIWPHRPIEEIYASDVAIRAVAYDAINSTPNDWSSQARVFAERMKSSVDRVIANAMIDDPRIIHIPFRDLSSDPIGAIRTVYGRGGLEVGAEFENRIRSWLADPENAADRYGRYPYSYQEFGLEESWIKELFADYSKRFGLI